MFFFCSFSTIKICKSFEKQQLVKTPDINTHFKKTSPDGNFWVGEEGMPGVEKIQWP